MEHLSFVSTEEEKADPGSTFHGLLTALRRRLWVIVLCLIVAPAAAYGISKSQTKEDTATAQLLFSQSNPEQLANGPASSTQGSADPTRTAATNVRLIAL